MQHACHLPADSVPALQRTPAPHVRMRHRAPEACSFGARPATALGQQRHPMAVWAPCQQALQGLVDAGRGGLVCRGLPGCRCTCIAARLWSELQWVPSWYGSALSQQPYCGCWQACPGLTGQAARLGRQVTKQHLTCQTPSRQLPLAGVHWTTAG